MFYLEISILIITLSFDTAQGKTFKYKKNGADNIVAVANVPVKIFIDDLILFFSINMNSLQKLYHNKFYAIIKL